MAVVIANEQAKTVTKALVDRWFYTYRIPSNIPSNLGKLFDDQIVTSVPCIESNSLEQPHTFQGVIPSVRGLIKLCMTHLKHCQNHKKPNWPAYLNSLVFTYNVMTYSTTGLQPYQLMFGCKAQTPCDNWLGLDNYNSDESVSKSSWVQEHHKLMQVWISTHWRVFEKVQSKVLSEQREKNCPSQKVIWSCCEITLKVTTKFKIISKTRNMSW